MSANNTLSRYFDTDDVTPPVELYWVVNNVNKMFDEFKEDNEKSLRSMQDSVKKLQRTLNYIREQNEIMEKRIDKTNHVFESVIGVLHNEVNINIFVNTLILVLVIAIFLTLI